MHVYIYDSFVNQNKYHKILARIETRLTDLGLNGKICRIGMMQNLKVTIEKEIDRGVKTLVIVGDDSTIHKSLSSIADCKIPIGIIPVGSNTKIAEVLGIKDEESACDIIASRRIEKFDLGQANEKLFLNKAIIDTKNTMIDIDQSYSIEIQKKGIINIINLPVGGDIINSIKTSKANDNKLELIINVKEPTGLFSKEINQTVLPFNRIKIMSSTEPLILDDNEQIGTPAEITISKKKVTFIVGKERSL